MVAILNLADYKNLISCRRTLRDYFHYNLSAGAQDILIKDRCDHLLFIVGSPGIQHDLVCFVRTRKSFNFQFYLKSVHRPVAVDCFECLSPPPCGSRPLQQVI